MLDVRIYRFGEHRQRQFPSAAVPDLRCGLADPEVIGGTTRKRMVLASTELWLFGDAAISGVGTQLLRLEGFCHLSNGKMLSSSKCEADGHDRHKVDQPQQNTATDCDFLRHGKPLRGR